MSHPLILIIKHPIQPTKEAEIQETIGNKEVITETKIKLPT